jgi:site-specific DNA-methyltransferase (adenine-specific)
MIKLIKGDCVEEMKKLQDNTIDLTVTSPPYDDLRTYEGELSWNFDIFKQVANELYRITKPGGVVVWVIGDASINGSETGSSFKQALYFKEIGFNLHDTMIWNKGSFAFPAKDKYHQVFEYMFVLSKGKPKTMNFIKDRKNLYVCERGASGRKKDGTRNTGKSSVREEYGKRFNIWNYPIGGGHSATDKIAFEHPAIFPEGLANDHIITWSNPGDTVFDPFMGSCTTGKMAYLNDRDFIGIEKVEKYYDISQRRMELAKSIKNEQPIKDEHGTI